MLEIALLIGMAAASMVVVFRAVPPGLQLVATGKKPWACNICMSFWFTILVTLLSCSFKLLTFDKLWAGIPAYIVCLWLLGQVTIIDFNFGPKEQKEAKNE